MPNCTANYITNVNHHGHVDFLLLVHTSWRAGFNLASQGNVELVQIVHDVVPPITPNSISTSYMIVICIGARQHEVMSKLLMTFSAKELAGSTSVLLLQA